MKNLQIIYFSFLLHHCSCQNYTQTKNLLDDDKLVLHYVVEDQQFKFKLVGKAGEQIGLAFSYDDSPRDGFVSVVGGNVVDLTLAGETDSGGFRMVADKRSNVVIVSASETDQRRIIEGYRALDNCSDENEDIYLEGDILKLFYMMGSNIYDEESSELDIDINKKSQYGADFLTIHTRVQRNLSSLETDYKSFSVKLEKIRPLASGESQCRMMRAPSRAQFFTGFTPIIHGYNGENGLIRQMTVYQCRAEAEYSRKTAACDEGHKESCSQVLFVWSPGSPGELFPPGAGMVRGDRKLLLEVVYNKGTGWLYDQSGLQIFYSQQELDQRLTKVVVRGGRLEGGQEVVTGLCAESCLSQPLSLLSVSLHQTGGEGEVSLASQEGLLVSGYRDQFQPTRSLARLVEASRLELRCSAPCWAVITSLASSNVTECGSESSGQSYCVNNYKLQSLGVLDTLGELPHKKCSSLGGNQNTDDLDKNEELASTAATKQRTESSESFIADNDKTTAEVTTVATTTTTITVNSEEDRNTSEGITDISDILRLNSVNFNSLNRAVQSSTSPTMKIDIAIIEETSTVLPLEDGEIGDLEINNMDTLITQEDLLLDIPESSNMTLNMAEDVTDMPLVSVEATEMADESELNVTRESRFLENPSKSEYHPEQDGQINFSKVYRSGAPSVSSFVSSLFASALIFLL